MAKRIVVLGVILAGCVSTNMLRFLEPDSSVLKSTFLSPSQPTYAITRTTLKPASDQCLSDVTTSFQLDPVRPNGARAEAHIYSRDPNEVHDTFASMTDDQIRAGRWNREATSPSVLPMVAALPYPSALQPDLTQPLLTNLGTLAIWGSGPDIKYLNSAHSSEFFCHRFKSAADAVEIGPSVQAAVVYRRSLCSQYLTYARTAAIGSAPLNDVLEGVTQNVWQNFKSGAKSAATVSQTLGYSKAISYVHLNATDPRDVTGGFIYSFHFGANDSDFWGTFRYEFGLDYAGVLMVTPTQIAWHDTGSLAPELGEGTVSPGLKAALGDAHGTLANTIKGRALAAQTIPNPSSNQLPGSNLQLEDFFQKYACEPSKPDTVPAACADAASFLAELVRLKLVNSGTQLTDVQLNTLRCSFGDRKSCSAVQTDPTPILNARWRCAPAIAANTPPYCHFVVPFKRLNAMPDQVELVFFDGPEYANAAYGLSLLAPSMCQQPESPASSSQWIPHSYATAQYSQ